MSIATTILFRPVGQAELDLIQALSFRAFPRRLPSQPIFYPVCNEQYATQIARDWNTRDAASGYVGYVTRFCVDSAYLQQFQIHRVGDATALELWISAEELDEFNRHIVGTIEVITEFRAKTC
jgi:hypothetical protein